MRDGVQGFAGPVLIQTITKLVEKRGTRRGDGVERVTTLSDAIDATTSSSSSFSALSHWPLREPVDRGAIY